MDRNKESNINKNPIIDVFSVNNAIVKFFYEKKKDIDLLKTLKLVYVCFGILSSLKKKYLFSERIEAWRLGPVVKDLYYPLRETVNKNNYLTTEESFQIKQKENKIDNSTKELIETICDIYLDTTTKAMVDVTHLKNGPWDKTYNGLPNVEIPKDLIIKHYDKILE